MPRYITTVNASTSASAGEDIFVEISGKAEIYLIRVRYGDGTDTTGKDWDFRVRLYHETTSTAGSSVTPNVYPIDQAQRASALTLKAKNGTTALALGGGTNTVLDTIIKNGRETFEYIARDDTMAFVTKTSSSFFAVCLTTPSSVGAQKFQVTVVWEE